MKKTISVLAATLGLAASGVAFAKPPVPMTDAQMDKVTAGALDSVVIVPLTSSNVAGTTSKQLGRIKDKKTINKI